MDPVIVVLVALLLAAVAYKPLITLLNKSSGSAADKKPPSAVPAKAAYYVDAEAPQPTPLYITPEQVKTYDDRPWRPFRWPYHQTMSIFKLDINHWLDMDKYYWHYIQEKERIYHEYGKDNIDWLPESEDACIELMETVRDHMLKRYPLLFTSEDNGVHVKNELTGEVLDFSMPLKDHPLIYVTKMAKEDFYIVQKRADGHHYLVAAAVPFPGGSFGISYKIGKSLDFIHSEVPYYESKLKKSMERWFSKTTAADPVERASWYCTWDHNLLCSNVYALKKGETVDSSVDERKFNIRVERQTVRRLPKTKAIIFTNHPVYYSIEEMKDEPLIPSLLKKIFYEAPEDIIKYKNFTAMRDHLLPYLDGLIQRQIDLGLITEDTPLKTLPSYPFAHFVEQSDEIKGWNTAMLKRQDEAARKKEEEAKKAQAA
ncbi:HRQ3 [Cyberlindnera jadinii]|uniref:HRQ3 protein n=1 Tax=Cyberlindnera jadinii (strain ATCC 18201 / CBS 1600 / BCRC 20928 / JCM 3617 / NBRC 0987 / NRRL Y-1542) TaxID=983966 RepID=A0A0H5C6X3_CYBJN|nr:HRQ3 [Cyberlindnera jadinii]